MDNLERLKEFYQPAELHPDLQDYYFVQNGIPMIKHPLVFSIFHTDIQNYIINKHYEWKKTELNKAFKEKKWSKYIFLHERPYRLQAFEKISIYLRPKQYWTLLGGIWIDSENIWQNLDQWTFFLTEGPKRDRQYFMSADDRKQFAKLPDTSKVYRGYIPRKNKGGYSYTLSKDKAQWFANRFHKNGQVIERTVKKSDVFAYLNGRNEQEVIIINELYNKMN